MRHDWLARALLRLYPHGWRERYGAEFLAYIADSELSWWSVTDIVGAASAERVRAAAVLIRYEDDPTAPVPLTWPRAGRCDGCANIWVRRAAQV
jgi:hypothetical protein